MKLRKAINTLNLASNEGIEFEISSDEDEQHSVEDEDATMIKVQPSKGPRDFSQLRETMEHVSPGVWKRLMVSGFQSEVTISESGFEIVVVSYSAYLDGQSDPFDCTKNWNRKPAELRLSATVPGLRHGILTMKPGEKAMLLLEKEMFYGDLGCPPRIPPASSALYEITIIEGYAPGLNGSSFESDGLEHVNRLKDEGNRLYRSGDLNDAARKYRCAKAIVEDLEIGEDGEINGLMEARKIKHLLCLNLAQVALKRSNFNVAVSYLKQSLKCCSCSVKSHYRLGCAYMGLDKLDKAKDSFLRALEIEPCNVSVSSKLRELKNYERCPETDRIYKKMFSNLRKDDKEIKLPKGMEERLERFLCDSKLKSISIDPDLYDMDNNQLVENLKTWCIGKGLVNPLVGLINNDGDYAIRVCKNAENADIDRQEI